MRRIEITSEEHTLLKNHLRTSPLIAIRARCHALLMREKGLKLEDIGNIVSRDANTITRWIKEWDECRMASIFTGHPGNENASKLTRQQRQEIKERLETPPPTRAFRKHSGMSPVSRTM